jgi:hypothetical protein
MQRFHESQPRAESAESDSDSDSDDDDEERRWALKKNVRWTTEEEEEGRSARKMMMPFTPKK